MRFFERQQTARAQTRQFLLLFGLILLALVLAMNTALALTWKVVGGGSDYPVYFFCVNTGLTLLFVFGGWWLVARGGSSGQRQREAGAARRGT